MEFKPKKMATLDLNEIKKGMPGITKEWGSLMAQAGLVCLEHHNHPSGVLLTVKGDHKVDYYITWSDKVTHQISASWNDLDDATEYGACCIAILLSLDITNYMVIKRSAKKTGFDYWLGEKNENAILPFDKKVRLEISGILSDTESVVNTRLKEKLVRTEKSDNLGLDAHVIVVEFSKPLAKYAEKHHAN